jgi:hypothetical protein
MLNIKAIFSDIIEMDGHDFARELGIAENVTAVRVAGIG